MGIFLGDGRSAGAEAGDGCPHGQHPLSAPWSTGAQWLLCCSRVKLKISVVDTASISPPPYRQTEQVSELRLTAGPGQNGR